MTIQHVTKITCDVPHCTNSIEVESWASTSYVGYCDCVGNIEFDPPCDWLTYEGVLCPTCSKRWVQTDFNVGDIVDFRRFLAGEVQPVQSGKIVERLHGRGTRSFKIELALDEAIITNTMLMVKMQSYA